MGRNGLFIAPTSTAAVYPLGARRVAIRRRVTSRSENRLRAAIAAQAPPEWANALRRALRTGGEDPASAAGGALRLFALITDDVDDLLDEEQRDVIAHARAATARWNRRVARQDGAVAPRAGASDSLARLVGAYAFVVGCRGWPGRATYGGRRPWSSLRR
jgi:hypothetical protein